MKSAIFITVLGLASIVFSTPTELLPRQKSLEEITDSYAFSISINKFISNRNARTGPSGLDWSSDGCSGSPDSPLGYNYRESCYRHDFGYRNFKQQSRFTDANKERIDHMFRKDMFNQCEDESFTTLCEMTATIYYEAVQVFGKKKAAEILAERFAAEAAAIAEVSKS